MRLTAEERLTRRQRGAFIPMEQAAVQIVRPGFRNEAHIAAQAPILSRNDTLHHLNFADGVRAHDVDLREAPIPTQKIGGCKPLAFVPFAVAVIDEPPRPFIRKRTPPAPET